jgi:hypothetical protein
VGGDLDRVQIGTQHLDGAPLVDPGPVDYTPPGRLEVDVHVDEDRCRPAHHVRAGSARRQFRQVGELR